MIGIRIIKKLNSQANKKKGSALLMTMMILFGIIAVAFSGASLVISGLRNSDLSAKSTVAYYNAESGTERLLYEVRKMHFDLSQGGTLDEFTPTTEVFSYDGFVNGGKYYVDYDFAASSVNQFTFTSIGDYKGVKRSVQVNF